MPLDFCVTGKQPIGHEIIFLYRPSRAAQLKNSLPRIRDTMAQRLDRKRRRNIFPDRVSLIAMYPALALFQIDWVRRQVPVGNGVTVMMKIKTLLPDRG